MTIYNPGIRRLLAGLCPPQDDMPVPRIRACTDGRGRSYYHAGIITAYYGFHGPFAPGGPGAENYPDLSELEWDINDLHIDADGPDIGPILSRSLAIVQAWQAQMERDFPETPFDIFLYVDEGRDLAEESALSVPAVTVHFYAVREGRHYIRPESISGENVQPAILMQVNQGPYIQKENAPCI